VNSPVRKPASRSRRSASADVEPLPLVPATWIADSRPRSIPSVLHTVPTWSRVAVPCPARPATMYPLSARVASSYPRQAIRGVDKFVGPSVRGGRDQHGPEVDRRRDCGR